MKLSDFSIRNSLLVNLVAIFFVIAGIFALFNIRREAFPNVNFDIVVIKTFYPGSTPREIEKLIVMPIEKELREVDDIDKITSVAIEGMALTILQLEEDAPNKDRVVNNIQRAVDQVTDLPKDIKDKPVVEEITTRNTPTIEVSLSGNLTEQEIRTYAKQLETTLLDIDGVASVAYSGLRDPEIWVSVNPDKISDYYLSLSDVVSALAAKNVSIPGGSLFNAQKEFILRTTGEFANAKDVEDVIIRANDQGHWLQVKDVARVTDTFEEESVIAKTLSTRAINLVVIKKSSGDTISIVKDVKKITGDFIKSADPRLKASYVNDLSYYIKRRLNVLLSNGGIGALLIVVTLVTFLSKRAAAGALMGMFTAILMALAVIYYMGYSINLLSMFGMIMVLGMLVDEDIVIAENVHRHIQEHEDTRQAVINGASEISKAVFATVVTTIVAFLPLLFLGGIIGKMIKIVPIVVIIMLTASLVEALIILPSHIYDLSKLKKKDGRPSDKPPREYKWYRAMVNGYMWLLPRALKNRYKIVAGGVAVVIIAVVLAINVVPFTLFPAKGIEIFFIRVEAPLATPLKETERLIRPLEKAVSELPKEEIDTFVTQVGIIQQDPHDPFTNRASHVGQIVAYLTPESKRDRTAEDIIEELREKTKNIQGFEKIFFERVKPGPPIGKAVSIRVRGDDFAMLEKIADEIKQELSKIEGVKDIKDDYEAGKTEFMIVVDERAAARAGISVSDIAHTIRQAYEGEIATTIRKGDEEINVRVRIPIEERENEASLKKLYIPNRLGKLIPLSAVTTTQEKPGISSIKHFDYKRTITVGAEVDEDKTTSVEANGAIEEKFGKTPAGYLGYNIEYAGEREDTQKAVRDLSMAFFLALVLVFIILVITFRSLGQSLIIFTTIPFSIIGMTFALIVHHEPFSFMVLLALVGLTGIVVDNAIIIIDFINIRRQAGLDLEDAITESCKIRLRPVLLVTLTTIAGIFPSAYGIGGNDPFIQPMALALNWGLVFSTILTLILIPCLYMILEDFTKK